MQTRLPKPRDPEAFERCRLDWSERGRHAVHRHLYEDLLALRRREAAFRSPRPGAVDGAVLRDNAFVLQFNADRADDERLLVVNAERSRRMRLLETLARVPGASVPAELVLAADQFLITPAGRVKEAARARCAPITREPSGRGSTVRSSTPG